MKKLFWGLCITSLVGLFAACEKLNDLNVQENALISQIADASSKLEVATSELPADIGEFIAQNYSPLGVQVAYKVDGKGFEVGLDNDVYLYFNAGNSFLGHFSGPGGHGGHGGPFGHGGPAGGGGCLHGDSVDVATLPAAIADYVAANYPDATISAAVVKFSGNFAVELSDGNILFFDVDGNYIATCGAWDGGPGGPVGPGCDSMHMDHDSLDWQADCLTGDAVDVAALPQVILDGIAANAPEGVTIVSAVVKPNGDYAVELSNGAVLIFDAEGNFEHPCGGPGGGHGGPGGGHGGPGGGHGGPGGGHGGPGGGHGGHG